MSLLRLFLDPVAMAALSIGTLGAEGKVFWVSAPVKPQQTVMVCGHFPAAQRFEIEVVRLSDGRPTPLKTEPRPFPADARARQRVKPLQASETALMFELPDLGGLGIYAFALRSPSGEMTPALVNCPEMWWALGDCVVSQTPFGAWRWEDAATHPGGVLRLFGRCLQLGPRQPMVGLRSPQGEVTYLRPSSADGWSLTVTVPAHLTPGRYELWVHNGYGGRDGWSGPLPLAVVPRKEKSLPGLKVTDFGARGDDATDDTGAIKAALEEAKERGGAIVLLPRGRFFVTETLEIPPRVTLRGAGRELTALCIPDTDEPPEVWLQGTHHFALEDLTIYCSNHRHLIASDMSGVPERSGHVRLARLRIRADAYRGHLKPEQVDARFRTALRLSTGGGDTVRLSGPDIRITDCDLYGSGRSLYLYRVVGALVANNILHNGRWGWYNFNCCENVVFEHNRIVGADLMSTGGSYACYGPEGVSRHIFTAHNVYENLHGWDREAFTSDAGGGAYFGAVAECRGKELVLADEPNWRQRDWHNALVAIVAGRGRGQWRYLRSWEGKRVQLDRPFDVAPDETSRLTITMMHQRYLFYDNEFRDVGIAIQFYGTAIEHVVANNRCWRAGGYHAFGHLYTGGVQPDLYVQFLGNEIVEGNSYRFGANNAQAAGPSHIGVLAHPQSLNFGCVVRGNRLHNNACIEVQGSNASVENVLLEGNLIEHADVGIRVSEGCIGVLLRNNRFVDCGREVYDVAALKRKWRARLAELAQRREPLVQWGFEELVKGRLSATTPLAELDLSATAVGTVRLTAGHRGEAMELDGNSYAVAGDSEGGRFALNLRNFTLTAWLNPKVISGRRGILAKRVSNTWTPFVVCLREGRLTFEATDREGQWSYNCASPAVLKPNQWQHIAVVVEEAKQVTLYVNGQAVHVHRVQVPLCTNSEPLVIGRGAWGGEPPKAETPGLFIGAIDELKIWTRPLSEEEIREDADYEFMGS